MVFVFIEVSLSQGADHILVLYMLEPGSSCLGVEVVVTVPVHGIDRDYLCFLVRSCHACCCHFPNGTHASVECEKQTLSVVHLCTLPR